MGHAKHGKNALAAERWLIERVAQQTGLSERVIDVHAPLFRLGLSSRELLTAVADIEDLFSCEINIESAYDSSLRELSCLIADEPPESLRSASTLTACLERRALENPDDRAFTFLRDRGRVPESISYRQLAGAAIAQAEVLRRRAEPGDLVLLLDAPGLGYISGFFACLEAGMVPVPGFPIGPMGSSQRIEAIARDCGARVALTEPSRSEAIEAHMRRAGIDELVCLPNAPAFEAPDLLRFAASAKPEDVGLLQYTSGSTATPKGVVLSQSNLVANCKTIKKSFAYRRGDRLVAWLPPYHDMGMIGCILAPFYAGMEAVLMSPLTFLRRPARWLRAISQFRASMTGGPNFAFDECVRRVSEKECEGLDLSSLRLVFNGSEPIRPQTLARFQERFAPHGFRAEAFYPCYGLAEASLLVAGSDPDSLPALVEVERDTLERSGYGARTEPGEDHANPGAMLRLVGCDRIPEGTDIRIVEPKSRREVDEGHVGEMWVRGPQVARGYWNRPEDTRKTFECRLANGDGPFLCTGDLGFLWKQTLWVTGRSKELLVIRGKNHYPHDIEAVVTQSHPALHMLNGAAFSLEIDGEEKLVITHELDSEQLPGLDEAQLVARVVAAVSEQFGLKPARLLFVRRGRLPVTSSGKVQRGRCREQFLDGSLPAILAWPEQTAPDPQHSAQRTEGHEQRDRSRGKGKRAAALAGEGRGAVPLTDGQAALWFVHQQNPQSSAYNSHASLRLQGDLDRSALQSALGALLERHWILGARFFERASGLFQEPAEDTPAIAWKDVRGLDDTSLERCVRAAVCAPFDLGRGPVCRVHVFRNDDRCHILVLVAHHIVCDGWSRNTILEELEELYAAACEGREAQLPAPSRSFADHALAEREQLGEQANAPALRAYWRETLGGEPPVVDLAPQRGERGDSVETLRFALDEALSAQLRAFSRRRGVTLYVTLLSAFKSLLFRYTGVDDIVVGTPVSTRKGAHYQRSVGYFLNTLPIRTQVRGESSFSNVLAAVDAQTRQAMRHRAYPLARIVSDLRPARDTPTAPLFQALFGLLRAPRNGTSLSSAILSRDESWRGRFGDLEVGIYPLERMGAQFDFSLEFHDGRETLSGLANFRPEPLPREFVARLLRNLETLLRGIVARGSTTVADLPLLHEEERRLVLTTWNATEVDHGKPRCIHEQVAQQAEQTPGLPALLQDQDCLNYAELSEKSESLATELARRGVGRGSFVPVLMNAGFHVPISYLAVMRCGAAFVPIDPAWPVERSAEVIARLGTPILLVDHEMHERLGELCAEARAPFGERLPVRVDELVREPVRERPPLSLDQPIYAMLTSGSTGAPKIAVNLHRGIANRFGFMTRAFGHSDSDVTLQTTNHIYDSAVWQFFWPLTRGGRAVLPSSSAAVEVDRLIETIERERVTLSDFVPSVFDHLVDRLDVRPELVRKLISLRQLIIGGEAIHPKAVARFRALCPDVRVTNFYGPTEASIGTIFHDVTDEDSVTIPIGRPIDNVHAIVCDADLNPVPIGAVGILHLGGACVGAGYLGEPERTRRVFVANPFPELSGLRLYDTGDRARLRADGRIDFLGRADDQVKIHGHRIEPAEISTMLSSCEGVAECTVVCQPVAGGPEGRQQLVAYWVASESGPEGKSLVESRLRQQLAQRLPRYMIPSQWVELAALPRLTSGKLDLPRLPAPKPRPTRERPGQAPSTPLGRNLEAVWCELLGVEGARSEDDFFQLGGASLDTLRLTAHLAELGHHLKASEIFEFPTFGALLELLEQRGGGRSAGSPLVDESPISPQGNTLMPSSEPGRAAAQRSEPGPAGRTRIESMGVYLPEARATLAERIAQTRSGVRFPLAEMTGIERMPVAGEEQYSLDLAERAIEECLSRSEYGTDEIDLLIACNISRLEGPAIFSIEPADASHLAGRFGMQRALAFDLSNACGGIFSGIYFADAFLRSNLARRALIVSGELISHLAETASKEIGDDFMDPRLGCLTVGDSGLALVLDRAANEGVGFLEVDLFTLGAYGKSCVAHATTQPHGGAIMHNHMITPAEARSLPGSLHAFDLLSRHGWIDDPPEHVILHQTSATTLRDVMREANRMFGRQYLDEHNTHIDLAERGNTATNSHFVTLMDGIREGRAQSGDRVAFGVSGSGQVLGSALYQLDDLPDRIRQGRAAARPARGSPQRHPLSGHRSPVAGRVPIRIAACASAPSTGDDRDPDDYTGAARSAARACLQAWARPRSEIDLLLYSGVYRHNFINEPALASLLAGELEINDTLERAGDRRSFCCDLMNGGVGFLQACYVAGATIAAGRARSALVVTSEVENNAEHHPYERLGLAEGGGAVVLERNYGERTGFGQFIFRSYPKHLGALVTRARLQGPHPFVERQRASNLESIYLEVIDAAVQDLLAREALKVSDFDLVLPPLMGSEFSGALARVLGFPQTRIITAAGSGADHLTCSIPVAFESAVKRGIAQGDRALVIAVGSGIDVGVATYHF